MQLEGPTAAGLMYSDTGGDGPVVVLLHGVLMNGTLWDTVVEGLGDRYRCIVPELPFGAHTTPMPDDADLSLPALATMIAEFLTELDLHHVTLVCNDWGGAQLVISPGGTNRVANLVLVCQGPVGSAQGRTVELPVRGHQNCPVVAGCSARRSVGQWRHPLAGGGLGEADAVAGGHDDVGVVEQPVDGGVGDGLGHEFVESGGVQVAGQGDGTFLVGGVDDAVERLGGLGGDRE